MIIGKAIYRDGHRIDTPDDPAALGAACQAAGGMAWIGLYQPSEEEVASIAGQFGLHELAVEDAVNAHQRPKLERYPGTLYCVLRPARYDDASETVAFGELHVFAGDDFVITVRHDDVVDLSDMRESLEGRPELLQRGPVSVLHAIMDRIVDDYGPVVAGLENDIDEIEDQVFTGHAGVSRRIYELSREVIAFGRASGPLKGMLAELMRDEHVDDEERRYLRDVQDHAIKVQEAVDGFRQLLENILSVNLTLETKALTETSIAQNEEVKRISAWAAILFAPTLIGTIYGMNFDHMPELHWRVGYPLALALMVCTSVVLYVIFKRRNWI